MVIFEYGPSTEYGEQTFAGDSIGNDNANHAVSIPISKLTPGTTYHFRAVASNFTGTTYGDDQTFNTPDKPKVEGASSSGVTKTSAVLEAKVTPNFSPTTYHFEYGPSGYTSATPESGAIGSDNVAHAVSTAIAGLAPGTTYHFRAVATNPIGSFNGLDQTFTTASDPLLAPVPTPPVRCKKRFVKRNGKCVKKKPKKHRAQKRRQGNGSNG